MYRGPEIDDSEILERLPAPYRRLLEEVNGYVAFHGGYHLRGACLAPEWHSLRAAWQGEVAIHRLFPTVTRDDIPFAEDALGDQYVLRDGEVWALSAETGELSSLGFSLAEFDARVREDPDETLVLAPLHEFRAQGGTLEPGQLLGVYPPFVFEEAAQGVTYRAIPVMERLRFLSDLARQLQGVADGDKVTIVTD